MVAETELNCEAKDGDVDAIERFRLTDGFQKLNDFVKQYCNGITFADDVLYLKYYRYDESHVIEFNGYIDHQSHEDYESLQDFLDDYKTTIEDIILDDGIRIIIDNDNY